MKTTVKTRIVSLLLALISMFGVMAFSGTTAFAATSYPSGTLGYCATAGMPVHNAVNGTKIGSLNANEGFTFLNYVITQDGYWWRIQYSANVSGGMKEGYINPKQGNVSQPGEYFSVGTVKRNTTLYAGTDTVLNPVAGSVSAGELVVVLARNTANTWVFVEFNTPEGRKRGYMVASNVDYTEKGAYYKIPTENNPNMKGDSVSGRYTVYGGPGTGYAKIGWVENEGITTFGKETYNGITYTYIEYLVNNGTQRKSGYIIK